MTKNGVTTTYTYNKDGIRTSKTVNGVRHDYILNGSTILAELWTENGVSYGLYFTYDEKGVPYTMEYRAGDTSTLYRYVTDAFGKITGLLDPDGNYAARYVYDGYGNCETRMAWTDMPDSTVASLNPFRYNGYYYDSETGLYYCNSRYYDAENCRFINVDGYVSTGTGNMGYNMYAYCGNDPVNREDLSGESWWLVVIAVVGLSMCATTLSRCSPQLDPAPLPYKTADEAAMAFANSTYSSSNYIHHEYGTVIYSSTTNGTTTYDFATPVAGSPHSVGYGNVKIPSGTTKVATAHTHPNSNSFSGLAPGAKSGDVPNAIRRGLDSYVIGPNLKLQKYSISSGTVSVVGVASPVVLTSQQQATLVLQFQISWDNHLGTCAFGCEHMTWPTP